MNRSNSDRDELQIDVMDDVSISENMGYYWWGDVSATLASSPEYLRQEMHLSNIVLGRTEPANHSGGALYLH